jgi:type IV secretory pathway protease TraF
MALAWAPVAARRLAALRHYLPYDVPLVKNVSAVAGARVCANGDVVLVDGYFDELRCWGRALLSVDAKERLDIGTRVLHLGLGKAFALERRNG